MQTAINPLCEKFSAEDAKAAQRAESWSELTTDGARRALLASIPTNCIVKADKIQKEIDRANRVLGMMGCPLKLVSISLNEKGFINSAEFAA